jgi:hypothetical protein
MRPPLAGAVPTLRLAYRARVHLLPSWSCGVQTLWLTRRPLLTTPDQRGGLRMHLQAQ